MNETINYEPFTSDENDTMSCAIDKVLTAPGFRKVYQAGTDIDWIMAIGNQDMEDGIRSLPPIEQEIVRLYFLDGRKLMDIAIELDMPIELVCGHIRSMRVRLRAYV